MNKKFSLQLTVDFTIEIDASSLTVGEDKDEQDYYDRQRRLLQAILSSDERTQSYLRYLIVSDIGTKDWQNWNELFLGRKSVEVSFILGPSISTLGKKDRAFFKDAQNEGILYENTEAVEDCFSVNMDNAEITIKEEVE